MNWQTLLEQQSEMALTQQTTAAALIPLVNYTVIRVSGEEAASFLQNLFSNDVTLLQPLQSQLSGFCNPKGRLLAIFQLIRREQDFLLLLPTELASTIAQRLTMFVLRSKVSIDLLDNECVVTGILGQIETDWPNTPGQGMQQRELLVVRQPGHSDRYLMLADPASAASFIDAKLAASNAALAPAALWQYSEISTGMPMIFSDTKEQFTPQQVNLELVGGVSFKKGCYPGQEVVARLHYLGEPSRRMYLATLDADSAPPPHTVVEDAESEVLGHVVQAVKGPDGLIHCHLSMKLAAIEKQALINGSAVLSLTPLANDA